MLNKLEIKVSVATLNGHHREVQHATYKLRQALEDHCWRAYCSNVVSTARKRTSLLERLHRSVEPLLDEHRETIMLSKRWRYRGQ